MIRSLRSWAISCDRGGRWHLSSFVMIPRLLLALCWLMVATFGAAAEHDLAGVYQGHAPAADAAQRVFTLDLGADGNATLTTLYIGKGRVSQRGRWTESGRQIELDFDAMGSN